MKTFHNNVKKILLNCLVLFSLFQVSPLLADSTANNTKEVSKTHHKLVIQISSDDIRAQQTALSNIVNIQKHYGMDNVEIELVAFGSGYRMLTPQSPLASRISSLAMQEITFTACMNTLITVKEKTGVMPRLIDGINTTQAGVPHIMELQEQGYTYIKY